MLASISDHVLDIAQNSVAAGATLITVELSLNSVSDLACFIIEDNGCGMDEDTLTRVLDPFVTSRTTRKVGLGLPMLKQATQMCGGNFELQSTRGKGTRLYASFKLSNVDTPPLGDVAGTFFSLVFLNGDLDFFISAKSNRGDFLFDTREVKKLIEPLRIDSIDMSGWLRDYLSEGINEIFT